jgi:hypothetical protein
MNVPTEILFEIIKHLDLDEFWKLCKTEKYYKQICDENRRFFAKMFLDKYEVDYNDRYNFVYLANGVSKRQYIVNDVIDYRGILNLYYKFYKYTHIRVSRNMLKCSLDDGLIDTFYLRKPISSFPIYPNLKKLFIPNNRLTTFPVQPKLKELHINHNNLTAFPVQPELESLHIQNNNLTSFPTQPKLRLLIANRNRLINLSTQPELVDLDISYNPLTHFSNQPKLEYVEISDDQRDLQINDTSLIKIVN